MSFDEIIKWLQDHEDKGRHEYNDNGYNADHVVTFANGDQYIARTMYTISGRYWSKTGSAIYINGKQVA